MQTRLTPITNLEDKILGIPKMDLAVFLCVLLLVNLVKSFVHAGYWPELLVCILFILVELVKRNLEKKEQSLFSVLWVNSRLPDQVAGVFHQRRFQGVQRDIQQ